jgi:hypothetical protein
MFTPAIVVALGLAALSGDRRPASVVLTTDGAGRELSDFLRYRLKETFEIDASPSPLGAARDGDFHVHVARVKDDLYSVRVDEAGAVIASRDIVAPDRDAGTEVWFMVKTTLRRALVSVNGAAPGEARLAEPSGPILETDPALRKANLVMSAGSELSVRVLGALAVGGSALAKGGMIGADYRFGAGPIDLVLGAELGYLVFGPGRGAVDARRIPVAATAGVMISDDVPVVAGLFGGFSHVQLDGLTTSDSAFTSNFGPFVRGRAELLDRLALVLDLRANFELPRMRYLLPDARTRILESAVTASAAMGVEWRWH